MKFQIFAEFEILTQKCSRGAQNDAKTLKIILLYYYVPIRSIRVFLEQKMQKNAFLS